MLATRRWCRIPPTTSSTKLSGVSRSGRAKVDHAGRSPKVSNKSGVAQNVISLPKGGGAIKGIGETFQPNLFSGTGNHTIPLAISPGRNGFGPKLSLEYSSGNGNGIFGLGWQLAMPRITRKTEKGLPRYDDSDVFVLSAPKTWCRAYKRSLIPPVARRRGVQKRHPAATPHCVPLSSPHGGTLCAH